MNALLWDNEKGVYFDRTLDSEKLTGILSPASFFPMMAGIPSKEQAEKMVKVLTDPDLFWTKNPVPTISKNHPDYAPSMWKGGVWLNMNYFCMKGLVRYGYTDLEKEWRQKLLDISPDNCKNVRIHDCEVEAGDDAIVFKSSYTLNKLGVCEDIHVWNCKIKSRAYCIKFGTETNGGFKNILMEDIYMYDTRICGFSLQSADGAILDGITLRNVRMVNVNVPLFIHLGKRMRGPKGREIGRIRNVLIENVEASGPYGPYEIVPCYYPYFKAYDWWQDPKVYSTHWGTPEMSKPREDWQTTSNICGLKGIPLENITLRNVKLGLDGGVREFEKNVKQEAPDYPQTFGYGWILPAKGIYFRYVDGLVLDNVTVETERPDVREDFVFENVENLKII